MKRALVLIAVLLVAPPVRAEKAKEWEVDAALAYTVLGGAHKTGGLTPMVAARHVWEINDAMRASAGIDLGIFGFGDELHWVGVMAGPTGSISVRPWKPDVRLTLGVQLDFARLPTCNDWAESVCLTSTGIAPAASFGVDVYTSGSMALTGYGQSEDKQKAKNAGFDEHLVKPVSIVDVERVFSEITHQYYDRLL